ncbi:MAG: DUF5723 family protein [bacterium]
MSKSILILLCLIFAAGNVLRGQEMLGTTLGNYAGINSVQLNPSGMHNSKQWLDLQLTGGDLFIQNNYLYLSKNEFVLWDIFKPGFVLPMHNEDYATEVRSFYTYQNSRPKDGFISARINGPGVMVIWGDHAFGISTSLRSVSSFYNLPYHLANFLYLGLNYTPQQNIEFNTDKRFSFSQMTWLEAGLSYSYKIYGRGFDRINAGISIKKLFGLAGLYAVSDQTNYIVYNDSTMRVNNLDATYGLALPVDYNSNNITYTGNPFFLGGGWGFDLGVTYTRLVKPQQKQYFDRLCEQSYEDYLYRIGLALIDVGGIKFKHNAQKYRIDNQASFWENLTHFDFQTVNQLMDTISYQFYGDPNAAFVADHFTLWLPSALSVQADYHYFQNLYCNASLIYPIQFSKASLHRLAQLSITPRYESQWFEANLPISLYNWDLLRIGLSLRFYFLTVGTEKLGPFFGLSNFTGIDFYFSIKVPLEKGVCGKRFSKSCPAFEKIKHLKL